MSEQKKYCPSCGSVQDADGVCTRENCARRKIQLRQLAAKKKSEEALNKMRSV